METYALLEKLLNMIEENIGNNLNINELASNLYISPVHLQRIFKFAFRIPIATYIRLRRLSVSLECLLKSNLTILDIANRYGFPFEQSYNRAFKREFNITPAEVRKSGRILKITPPISLFPSNKLSEGVLFGPEIVMMPKFHLAGRQHIIPFCDSVKLPQKVAKEFWQNEHQSIKNSVNPDIYYGLSRIAENVDFSYYLTSVQVKNLKNISPEFEYDTFDASLCVRFHYIGKHHYYDINPDVARGMYNAIVAFVNDNDVKYDSLYNKLFFEKIDTSAYNGTYCMMEWFSPVFEKRRKMI